MFIYVQNSQNCTSYKNLRETKVTLQKDIGEIGTRKSQVFRGTVEIIELLVKGERRCAVVDFAH